MTNRLATASLALALVALAATRASAAAACTNPGKDGPANVSGIVNSYYPGVSASAGSTTVQIGAIDTSSGGAATPIAAGDLIVVMQMQDADIGSSNDSFYGGSSPGAGQIALNNSGVYEYLTVAASYVGGGSVPVTAPLLYSYRTQAAGGFSGQRTFQVIRVPQYSSVTLAGTVTAAPWNGSTGGVVILDVAGQLSWNGQTIDVTGRGFRGGGGLWMRGRVAGQPVYAATDYVATLVPSAPVIAPNPSSTAGPFNGSHAVKGEGIAGTPRYLFIPAAAGPGTNGAGAVFDTGVEGYPNGSLARGAPGNAGGGGSDGDPQTLANGGNDQNTGGGGGGGYATGGTGGFGWTPGTPPGSPTGGLGGEGVPMAVGRVALGGGGGAGTSNNATGNPTYGLASSGAPGGGLVLVRAKTIVGAGTINARGTSGNQSVCNDASGGGGGGGAVMIYASGNNGNVGTLTVNAPGGAGGSNTGNGTGNNSAVCGAYNNQPHGPGGGGGGGFVALSSASNATINVQGGANGTTSPSATSTSPYGSSSSPGGYQINTVVSTDVPGSSPSSLCYPLLTVTKVTNKANTVQGGTTSYTIAVSNAAGYGTATGAVLADALPAPLNLATTDTVSLAGGAARTSVSNPAAGATVPSWGVFTIPAGGSVAISFTVNVPAATPLGTLQNSASVTYDDPTRTGPGQTVTPGGTYSTGDFVLGSNYNSTSSAGEDVTVRQPATLTKGFSPVSILAGGTTQLSIQVSNFNAVALAAASFTDSFPAGLTAVGGPVTVTGSGCSGFAPAVIAAGATSFTQTGGTVPANGTCTFAVDVTAAVAASYTNTLPAGAFTNNLNVTNVAAASATLLGRPGIAKSFSPTAVPINSPATMSFAIANPNAGQALTGANFSDSFPAGLVATGGAVTVTGAGCSGFAPAAIAANATSFALTSGTLPAGATCTVSFAVQSATAGGYSNTASGVTTTETVVAGAASNTAQLGVGAIGIAKAFGPASIRSGNTSTVTLTLTNPTGIPQTAGALTDTLTGMSVSSTAIGGTCLGVLPPALSVGQTSLSFSGINIPTAGCTITFSVTSSTAGTQTNTTSGVSTALLAAGPPSNTASLTVIAPPTISKAFSPATIQTGAASTITFTLLDPDTVPLTGASFSDVLNANLAVAGSGTVAAGGTCAGAASNSFVAGTAGATLSFTGLTIPAGPGGCTVTVPVTSNTVSPALGYANAASGVASNEAATGAASNTARLVVAASPTIAKAFGTSPIAQGGTSAITFTITNPSAIALTAATFSDVLTNMQIAAAGAAGGTCAGAASNSFAAGQTGTIAFAGLTIPASGSCTVTVTVTSSTSGANPNTASGVAANETPVAGSGSNTANLVVYSPPQLAVGFSPGLILSSAALATSRSTLTVTLTNANAVPLTAVAFTDTLSSMQIYAAGAAGGTCAGAAGNGFAAGATSLSFSGLTVPANGSCTVTVQVASANISPAAGWPDSTSGATSAQTPAAGAGSAPAWLTVVGYATIAKAFSPASVPTGGVSTIIYTLANPNAISLTNAGFNDVFPAAPSQMRTPAVAQNYIGAGRGTCASAMPSSGNTQVNSVTFTGIAIPANSSCTVMVDVNTAANGSYSNTASGVTSAETGASAGPASNTATLAVGHVGIAKSFTPATVGVGEKSRISFLVTSSVGIVLNGNVFTDNFPAGMTVASPLTTSNTCGGTLRNAGNTANSAAGDTGISLQGGTLAANGSCTITVDVTTSAAGSFANTTSAFSSASGGGPNPPSNTATLTVVQQPTIAEAFSPASLDTWRNSTLTFTLTNPGGAALTNCAFSDTLTGFFVSNPPSIGGSCTGVTNTPALAYGATSLNLNVPTLSAGSCTVTVAVTSGASGTYTNAAGGLKCDQLVAAGAASNTASVTFNKLPIQLLKSASSVSVAPGSTVTYTISYANPNVNMSLQNIVISDSTPQYTGFTSASCGPLPASLTSCTIAAPAVGASGTVTWTFGGSLNAGTSGTVSLTVTVK